jgi:hypothetical protein
LKNIPWEEDTISKMTPSTGFSFDPDCLLKRIDPLDYYRRFSTFTSSSFLTTTTESSVRKQVMVAAADLRATFKAARSTQLSITDWQPYVYHTVDDAKIPVVVDTGASVSVIPLLSDFVGLITSKGRWTKRKITKRLLLYLRNLQIHR